jgi:hypothetical protein
MNKFELLEQRLNQAFENFSKVFKTELNKNFYIAENEKTSTAYIILKNELDKVFTVENNSLKAGFIPIDGKFGLLSCGKSHCDFILFNENDFCFIELKLNASSSEERAVRKNRKKAVDQLSSTIDLFDEKLNSNYEDLNLEAYICTPQIYPRSNTAWQEIQIKFLESKRIELYEQNKKVFLS